MWKGRKEVFLRKKKAGKEKDQRGIGWAEFGILIGVVRPNVFDDGEIYGLAPAG
jgi:hypothetical protein